MQRRAGQLQPWVVNDDLLNADDHLNKVQVDFYTSLHSSIVRPRLKYLDMAESVPSITSLFRFCQPNMVERTALKNILPLMNGNSGLPKEILLGMANNRLRATRLNESEAG